MPDLLQNRAHMPATSHASNGARLVTATGDVLPLQRIELTCEAFGGVARTRLHQYFSNTYPAPLELSYVFPLPADGAVSGYEIRAGHRVITGRVEPRDKAREQFDAARLEGRTAGLVEQERANLFTQHLGNIPAATDVIVELMIDQPLRWVAGFGWEWRFPTVVAPRYLGAEGVVPDADRVTVDVVNGVTSPTASVTLTIGEDLSIEPTSPTHPIVVTDPSVARVENARLDRDIVIRWAVPRHTPGCSIRTMRPAGQRGSDGTAYGLVTIVPPTSAGRHFARDLVLLLDVSGSMDGRPLEHLKAIVTSVIDSLADDDRMEIIAFSSSPVRFHDRPMHASAAERKRASAWVRALQASGGTELIPAIEEALRPLRDDTPRQVIIVTDGQIGFEAAAVRAIRDRLPRTSRLHAVGVGSASNQAFLRPAARAGRGVEVVIDLDEAATPGAERIVAATREPVMIDVVIEGTAIQAVRRLPDLLSGSPVVVTIAVRPEGGSVTVRGVTPQGTWEERLDVPPPGPGERLEALPALWAREAIESLELDLACGGDRADIDRQIERIGVKHGVSSRLTSWIAIAEEPSVDPREPVRTERIPQALPYGLNAEGLGLGLSLGGTHMVAAFAAAPPVFMRRILASARRAPHPGSPSKSGRMGAVSEEMRKRLRSQEHAELRQAVNAWRARISSLRDDMARRSTSQIHELTELRRAIDDKLSTLGIFSSGDRRHGEQETGILAMLEELDGALDALESERRRAQTAWTSTFEAIGKLRERVTALISRLGERHVLLRGRLLATPGRPSVTIEIHATEGFDWQAPDTVMFGSHQFPVVELGTTRSGPIAAGSLVRLELAASSEAVRPNVVKVRCGDTVLIIGLTVAD